MVSNQLQHKMLFCRQRETFNTGAQKDPALKCPELRAWLWITDVEDSSSSLC